MQPKQVERYFFFGLLLATFIFTFFIFKPFWVVLVLGISFSIVLYPLFRWLRKYMSPWIASLLTLITFTVVLCGPLLGIGALIFNQSQNLYSTVTEGGNIGPFMESLNENINKILPDGVNFDLDAKIADFVTYLSSNIDNIFKSTISAFFSFILMLLIIFYFLKDGKVWKRSVVDLSPLGDRDDERIINRLAESVDAVIKGSLFIAVVQGLLMGFGLFIFNVPNAALWGVVAAVCSLVPTIGTAIVSVPAIIFLFIQGDNTHAIGLIIWAAIVVGMVDNFLGPLIYRGKSNIPPLLILFAVLGGIAFLGPVGILIGPLTLSLLYTLISIYRNEFKQNEAV